MLMPPRRISRLCPPSAVAQLKATISAVLDATCSHRRALHRRREDSLQKLPCCIPGAYVPILVPFRLASIPNLLHLVMVALVPG
jgi:hypothetical protein